MADEITPATRWEKLLSEVLGEDYAVIPVTRIEKFLANILGEEYDLIPVTRIEKLLAKIAEEGGGGGGAITPDQYLERMYSTAPFKSDAAITISFAEFGLNFNADVLCLWNATDAGGGQYTMQYAFNGPNRIIVLPKVAVISNNTFRSAQTRIIDTASVVRIFAQGIQSPNCDTIILRNNVVPDLRAINGLPTCFQTAGSGGTLYVPQALIAEYQAATNWSTILGYTNNQILPIEGSIYETQYADGTPIT